MLVEDLWYRVVPSKRRQSDSIISFIILAWKWPYIAQVEFDLVYYVNLSLRHKFFYLEHDYYSLELIDALYLWKQMLIEYLQIL